MQAQRTATVAMLIVLHINTMAIREQRSLSSSVPAIRLRRSLICPIICLIKAFSTIRTQTQTSFRHLVV